jgi:hypothetical protein
VALRVIGAGLGRTGTLSLKAALERLGFGPCEHMGNVFDRPERFALWAEALDRKAAGRPIDWAPLFAAYGATTDWPGAFFWRELAAAHPEAKVVLSVRDPDRWYDSVRRTIYRTRGLLGPAPVARGLGAAAPLVPYAPDALRVADRAIWDGTFGGRFGDRRHALAVFAAHSATVRRAIAPERLLVFDVRQGWAPLCAFLNVAVPAEPFPHLNDRAAFGRRVGRQTAPVLAAAAGVILGAGGLVLAVGGGRGGLTGDRADGGHLGEGVLHGVGGHWRPG